MKNLPIHFFINLFFSYDTSERWTVLCVFLSSLFLGTLCFTCYKSKEMDTVIFHFVSYANLVFCRDYKISFFLWPFQVPIIESMIACYVLFTAHLKYNPNLSHSLVPDYWFPEIPWITIHILSKTGIIHIIVHIWQMTLSY